MNLTLVQNNIMYNKLYYGTTNLLAVNDITKDVYDINLSLSTTNGQTTNLQFPSGCTPFNPGTVYQNYLIVGCLPQTFDSVYVLVLDSYTGQKICQTPNDYAIQAIVARNGSFYTAGWSTTIRKYSVEDCTLINSASRLGGNAISALIFVGNYLHVGNSHGAQIAQYTDTLEFIKTFCCTDTNDNIFVFAADNQNLILYSSEDVGKNIYAWDIVSGTRVKSFQYDSVSSGGSPTGIFLFSGYLFGVMPNGQLYQWQAGLFMINL